MFCFSLAHYKKIAILETRVEIAEQRLERAYERLKEKDAKILALIAETNELVANLMNMEQYVRQNSTTGAVMPSQARDWARVAESLEARALYEQSQKNIG